MRILSGAGSLATEDDDEARVKRANRVDPSERLACRIVPTDDVEVTTRYW
jgi:ferredoxin